MATAILMILLLAVLAGLGWMAWDGARDRQRQTRLIQRMRRDAERQERAIFRLTEGMNASIRQVNQLSQAMEVRQERLRRTLDERVGQMQRSNDQSLERVRQTVSEKLDGRLNESFRLMNAQLEGVHQGLGEMKELSGGMLDLKKMLGGVKTRGVWGEVQLRALMTELFAPSQYVENAAIPEGSQQRVEFALRLPLDDGGERLLPIDSKFPQEDYLRLIAAREAGDPEAAKKCAAQLERAVLEQARRIRDKYIQPPLTLDYGVMFLPTESLYAEVARRDGLIQRVQERYRVVLAGPATFAALLTSVQLGLKSVAMQRQSGEALRRLAAMKQELGRFDESVQRMRQRLGQAEEALNALEARGRKVLRAMEGVTELNEQDTGGSA